MATKALLTDFSSDVLYLCTIWKEDLFKSERGAVHKAEEFRITAKLPHSVTCDARPGEKGFRDSLAYRFFVAAVQLPAGHDTQLSNDSAYWCIAYRKGMERSIRVVDFARANTRAEDFAEMEKGGRS